MTDAFIYDAVRTPRGLGKKSGSLHEVTPVRLASTALEAIRDRNNLDTADVDDVILGCVEPVGEQGADIARLAVLMADYDQSVGGMQIHRFCSSGLDAVKQTFDELAAGVLRQPVAGVVVEQLAVVDLLLGKLPGFWSDIRPCLVVALVDRQR